MWTIMIESERPILINMNDLNESKWTVSTRVSTRWAHGEQIDYRVHNHMFNKIKVDGFFLPWDSKLNGITELRYQIKKLNLLNKILK